ncbi:MULTISPECIES: glutathione S-transferase family protein [Serratia]|uniref:glutathione S-transferase family protein n=1 Tax=Serratia TaxID=613 RepID=UPI0011CC7887|nr:glutathione S-transferase family protein [Serratia bockelmannii]EIV2912949.1 glutathione S-transferase family protein [Serratia marcescens]TXE52796.1 glutathione S-transferase family protein [Serratia bockelmannii]
MHDTYTLFGTQGCGSTIVAAALALTAFPWGYEEVDYTQDGPERDRLLALNPLGQVPTLVLPNDEVMTESAAIILLLHDRAPHAELAPPGGSPLLPRFLRWLLFINAEIYPTFTYADHPQRWQPQATGAEQLKNAVMDYRERLLQQLNAAAGAAGPWFLGKSFSALDLYVAVMCNWRPGRAWFRQHCPRLYAIAERVEQRPELNALLSAHFDGVAPLES